MTYLTAFSALQHAAKGAEAITFYAHPDQPGERVSYHALYHASLRAAGFLTQLGLPAAARIGLVASNSASFITQFLACQAVGLTPCNLAEMDPRKPKDAELARFLRYLDAAECTVVVVTSGLAATLQHASGFERFQIIAADAVAQYERTFTIGNPQSAPDSLALIQFTSGTTQQPKAIALTHQALSLAVQSLCTCLAVTPKDRAISWLPLAHDMGFVGMFLCALYSGISLHLLAPKAFLRAPLGWLHLAARLGATITYVPPFGLELCTRRLLHDDTPPPDLAQLRIIGIGAEPIDHYLLRDFISAFGLEDRVDILRPSYGMAEVGLGITIAKGLQVERLEDSGRDYTCCGTALPNIAVCILDETGAPCSDRQAGRICVSGPTLAVNIPRIPNPTGGADLFDTGDIGFMRDHALYVLGRGSNAAKVNGRMINLEDVDRIIQALLKAGANEAVAVLEPGHDRGHDLVLYIHRAAMQAITAEAITDAVYQQLSIQSRVVLLDRAPGKVSASGKRIRAVQI